MKTTECNEIVIEYPGYIQSFGYLLGINVFNDKVEFISENVLSLLDVSREILGVNVNTFNNLAFISNSQHFRFLKSSAEEDVKYIDKVLLNNKEYHITYYRHLDIIYIELEECILDAKDNSVLVKKIKNLVSYRQGSNIWEFVVDKIKEITDYDRVMIYQFNEDKSGKVVAEAKNANMESFLNLHYPESDIPSQARALYLKNFKRILSDVNDNPIKLISKQKNVDLSLSSVRSLSPIHVEYLINAKISSSFSISIIIDNQLWGLVTCHSTYQKHIDLDHRLSAEIATFIAANSYHSYLSSNAMVFENILQEKCFQIKKDFLSYQNISDSLTKNIERLRLVSETDGLAVIIDGQISKSGSVPDNEIIKRIAEWGITNIEEEMYYSDTFFNEFGEILGLDKNCCGIAISFINKAQGQLIIWFKKEFKQQIAWAGVKNHEIKTIKIFNENKTMVSPRKSFEVFNEEIMGKSSSWDRKDRKRILTIRELIDRTNQEQLFQVNAINEQLNKSNTELTRLNEELDSYSHTISHDLATPLTVMKLNMQILLKLNTESKNINQINNVLNEIDNMSEMMSNVLKLSKLKYSEFDIEDVNPLAIIEKSVLDAKLSYNDNAHVEIGDVITIRGEKSLIAQVFQNIITNAVKYSSNKNENAHIMISSMIKNNSVVYIVEDNGIGIPYQSKKDVFKVFNRMSNTKSFLGSGVGLSIVENIMKKLNGSIDFESEVNVGTKFIITFPDE